MKSFVVAAIAATSLSFAVVPDETGSEAVRRIVSQIQRADYEGDRAALMNLGDELTPFLKDTDLAPRVRYWRGFAMWRRAINGFNDSVDSKKLESDLNHALDQFKEVKENEPGFADARVGMVSCLGNLIYINGKDPARVQELLGQIGPLAKEAKAAAPDNPRLLWVAGPNLWITPPEQGGGQEKAIATYEKGLELSRRSKPSGDPLEPSWGEAELLMNLAWSNLNRMTPDLDAAERYARSALEIVPYWHYVRDILLPQIIAAKA